MHTLSADDIRSFVQYIRTVAEYMLGDLKRDNAAKNLDAYVVLVEAEEYRRGLSAGA